MLGITILGNNSAVPAFDRHPTSQIIATSKGKFMVDCGEGTQIQMMRYKIRRSRISHIFISHLHGDHYFGLIGLLNSFALLGRIQELHVVGPAPLQQIMEFQLNVAHTQLTYDLHFHTIRNPGFLMTVNDIDISCFKTNHRIECYGFLFREKRNPRKIDPEKIMKYDIPFSSLASLQKGDDYVSESTGKVIKNVLLTSPAPAGKTYAFCADTKYDESLIPHIEGVDLVYHETTYLDNFAEKAGQRFHSTTRQAGTIARKAGVKKLLIGHFSSKYENLDDFANETREVFPNTELALEGVTYLL